jgi:hypothetical protein
MIKQLRFSIDVENSLYDQVLIEKIKYYKKKRTQRLELPDAIYQFFEVEILGEFEYRTSDVYLWRWVILMYTIIDESDKETLDIDKLLHLMDAGVETFMTEELFRLIIILYAYKDNLLIDFLIRELSHRLYTMTRKELDNLYSTSRGFTPQGIERLVPEKTRKLNHILRVLTKGLKNIPELYNKAMRCLPRIENVMSCEDYELNAYIIINGQLWHRRTQYEKFKITKEKNVDAVISGHNYTMIVKDDGLYRRGWYGDYAFSKIEELPPATFISVACSPKHVVCVTSNGLYRRMWNEEYFVKISFPYGVIIAVACGMNNMIVVNTRGVLYLMSEKTGGEWLLLETIDLTTFVSLHTKDDDMFTIVTTNDMTHYYFEPDNSITEEKVEQSGISSFSMYDHNLMFVRNNQLILVSNFADFPDHEYFQTSDDYNVIASMLAFDTKFFITSNGNMYSIDESDKVHLIKELQGVLPHFSTEKIKRKTNKELSKLTQQCYRCQSTALFKDVILGHAFCNEECYNEFYYMIY